MSDPRISLSVSAAVSVPVSTSTSTSARACGKVILLGEHAVVYGVPALAVGIDRGARAACTARPGGGESRLHVRGWGIDLGEHDTTHDLARAFAAVLAATREAFAARGRAPLGAVSVDAETDLFPGGGLGCSAAIGVAVARALDPGLSDGEASARAMAWERIFHGNPSGIDAAVAASGGCVQFSKAAGIEPVGVRGGLTLCVGSSGSASSTKAMVEAVARMRERRPEVVAKAFEGIHALVRNARLALEAGDRFGLGRLMDLNQMLLSGLFLSTPDIERMCAAAREAGALGAKVTGAGGGGCVVALVAHPSGAEPVLEAWRREGFDGFATRVASTDSAFSTLQEAAL